MRLYHCVITAVLSVGSASAVCATLPLALVACGGSTPPASAPGSAGGDVEDAGSAAPLPTTTTTTTLTLADGGDLTGSKLETKTTTVIPATTQAPTQAGGGAGGHRGERGRTVEDIRVVVGTRRDEIRGCYDRSLKDHPGIEGDLDVRWVVDPKGVVTEVTFDEMKSSIAEPGVRACVASVIKSIKFAESEKGLESRMHYPFNFNPRSGGRVAPDSKK